LETTAIIPWQIAYALFLALHNISPHLPLFNVLVPEFGYSTLLIWTWILSVARDVALVFHP
jgi:hypothetical protein